MSMSEHKINVVIDTKFMSAYLRSKESELRSLMLRMRMQPPREVKQFLYEMAFAFGFVFQTGAGRWRPKNKFIPWYERW